MIVGTNRNNFIILNGITYVRMQLHHEQQVMYFAHSNLKGNEVLL